MNLEKLINKIRNKRLWFLPMPVVVLVVVILSGIGIVAALNSWFGVGSIPSDTFTRGLVGYWSFDEGIGQTVYDTSDSLKHGTLGSDDTVDSEDPVWTTGRKGGALLFDGADDHVAAGNVYNGVKTLEFWMRAGNTTSDIINIGSAASTSVSSGDITTTGITNPSIYVDGLSSTTVDTDWHFVTITTNTGINSDSLDMGGTTTSYFTGIIDEVRIYNRVLSEAEIRYHYDRGGPVAHWKFDEGSGSTAFDSSGNGNDGTLQADMATTSWTTGKYGGALNFDGVDDYVNVPDSAAFDITEGVTVEFWVKPD